METAMIQLAISGAHQSDFTGSIELALFKMGATDAGRASIEAQLRTAREKLRSWHVRPNMYPLRIGKDQSDSSRIFDAIQTLYLSHNRPRDRRLAERITDLHRIVLAEAEQISAASLEQFTTFFLKESKLTIPRITMTPDGTIRARWIYGPKHFVAIEFTGKQLVRLVAEVPRDDEQIASYFVSEPIDSVAAAVRNIGGWV
jgi:hypothetical protein